MEQTNYAATILSIVGVTMLEFYEPLLPWLLFAFMLILSDLRFGILASKKRGEEIRHSRMWRRTFNKAMDYVCWVTLAGLCSRSIGVVFGIPVVSMGLLIIIYGIEISSCVNNYFVYKGIKKKFNFWKLLNRPEVENAIEEDVESKTESHGN
jgi:uncharacterized membrane protein YfcA